MAGRLVHTSRVLSKYCRRDHNTTCTSVFHNDSSTLNRFIYYGRFKRKAHTISTNRRTSVSVLNYQDFLQKRFFTHPIMTLNQIGRLPANIHANSFHMTCSIASAGYDGILSDDAKVSLPNDNMISSIGDAAVSSPSAPLAFDTAQDLLASGLAEHSLESLGLGGNTPIGLIQHALDFSHSLGLPWWGCIVCGTILFRILIFPLVIKSQVNAAKLNAIKPEMEKLRQDMLDAKNRQNPTYGAAASLELQELLKKHDCNPVKSLIAPLIQLPLFVSFFFGIKGMANLPIESMKTGGIFWFHDLTLADPYYILPIVCAGTMLIAVETGAEMPGQDTGQMKNMFRVMCLMMFPITYTFPSAILTYWVTSNFFTLAQAALLRQHAVRKYYGLPDIMVVPKNPNVKKSVGFFEEVRIGFENALQTKPKNPRVKQNKELFQIAKKPGNK